MAEKRSSSRITTLSKSMRTVDDVTRKEVKDKRLRALEADNYNDETVVEVTNEESYSSEDNGEDEPVSKRKRVKPKVKPSTSKSHQPRTTRRIRDLDRIMDAQKQQLLKLSSQSQTVCNYASVEAPPSTVPGRSFCSVCGYASKYSCTRCGMKYCSIRCNNSHKETRCLKFSVM